jgi:peptidoglycan LD-endopeptidase CwlK
MDKLTIDRINTAHPAIKEELFEIYRQICEVLKGRVMCRFAYVIRTLAEQEALYAQGRTKPGKIVTNAKAGWSYHNYGLAVDIVMIHDKDGNGSYETASWDQTIDLDGDGISDWQEVVTIFKAHGWAWGGDWKFKDAPHFEKTFGIPVAQLFDRLNKKQFMPNTNFVKL